MDTKTRRSVLDRDNALDKVGVLTRRLTGLALVGALLLMAGFANLIPTHLPSFSAGSGTGESGSSGDTGSRSADSGSGSTSTGSASNASSGLQAPSSGLSSGSGATQVTSGGS